MDPGAPAALPAHRVALRVAVGAPVVGALGTALAIPVALAAGLGRARDLPLMLLLLPVGIGAGAGLVLLSEGAARHAPPRARPPLLALVSSASALFVCCAVGWVWSLLEGSGTRGAWERLGAMVGWALAHLDRALLLAAAFLLPTLTLGWLRTLERPPRLVWQALAGMLAGLAAFALMCLVLGPPPAHELVGLLALFALLPAVVPPGASAAVRLEERLLRWVGATPPPHPGPDPARDSQSDS